MQARPSPAGVAPAIRKRFLAATLCACLWLPACGEKAPPPEPYVATVNGEKIFLEDFRARLEREKARLGARADSLTPQELALLKEEVLQTLATEILLHLRARELAISVSEQDVAKKKEELRRDYGNEPVGQILQAEGVDPAAWEKEIRERILREKLLDREVRGKIFVTEEEARRHFDRKRKDYVLKKRVRAAQIVVREKAKARDILQRLKRGEDFDRVARETSIAPEAERGGDLGFFGRGALPEVLEEAAFRLKPGEISAVIRSPFGFHIVKVLAVERGRKPSFEEAREQVVADLRAEKEAEACAQWLRRLQAATVIGKGSVEY